MQKAREIFLKAKRDVTNSNFGLNVSKFGSDGLDFVEIREYANDEFKKINWKATAKSRELKTNVFNEARQLNIIIAYMIDGSLNFGSKCLKFELGAQIFANLALAGVYSKNIVYPYIFSDKFEEIYPPISREEEVYRVVDNTLNLNILGKSANFATLSNAINLETKKRSMIFVISDFLEQVDLSQIAVYNDVYAICLRDRAEEDISIFAELNFVDPVNFNEHELNIDKSTAQRYKELLKMHDYKLKEHFFNNKISSTKIYEDDDIVYKISRLMS
ncbi:MAG: DUF58 domain-containing protein [Campylobacter sp.]|nr:DUF58 domain-containing protein [Campylobacter sp.]